MKPLLKRFTSSGGNAAIEFALLAPILLILAAGITEFGRIFTVYNQVNRLATQYAIAWADCVDTPVGACGTELTNLSAANTIANIFPLLQSANLTLQMFQIDMVSSTDGTSANPTVIYAYPAGATMTTAQYNLATARFSAGQTGVIVTASYQHSLTYFPTLMTPYLGGYLNPTYTVAQLRAAPG